MAIKIIVTIKIIETIMIPTIDSQTMDRFTHSNSDGEEGGGARRTE